MLDTRSASQKLSDSGINMSAGEIAKRARSGDFPGALKQRGQWKIPEESVEAYVRDIRSRTSNYLSVLETSAILGVPPAVVRRYCRYRKLPGAIRTGTNSWIVPSSATEQFRTRYPDPAKVVNSFDIARSWISSHKLKSFATFVLALLALIFGAISAGADIGGARSQLKQWGILREFPRSKADEILVIVFAFHVPEGTADREIHREIQSAMSNSAEELRIGNFRVEIESTRLNWSDRELAESIGRDYGASMVVWGSDTGVRTTTKYLNLNPPDPSMSEFIISETERSQLADPARYAEFVTNDLPGEITFLALFALTYAVPCFCADEINS